MQINFVRGLISLTFLGKENPEVPLAQIRKHKYMKMVTASKKDFNRNDYHLPKMQSSFIPFGRTYRFSNDLVWIWMKHCGDRRKKRTFWYPLRETR